MKNNSSIKTEISCNSTNCKSLKSKRKNNRASTSSTSGAVNRQKLSKTSNPPEPLIEEINAGNESPPIGNINETNHNENVVETEGCIVPAISNNENDEETFVAEIDMNPSTEKPMIISADEDKDAQLDNDVICQKSLCPSRVCGGRSKVKRKLESNDAPSDFLLVEGPVYVKRSLMESIDRENSDPGSSKNAPSDSLDSAVRVQRCTKCCRELHCCIKGELEACHSDTKALVDALESKYGPQGGEKAPVSGEREQKSSRDCLEFYLQETHGDADGDDKYHYLMVDNTTSYSSKDYLNKEIGTEPPPPSKTSTSAEPTPLSIEKSQSNSILPSKASPIEVTEERIGEEKEEEGQIEFNAPTESEPEPDRLPEVSESAALFQQPELSPQKDDRNESAAAEGEGRRISIVWDQSVAVAQILTGPQVAHATEQRHGGSATASEVDEAASRERRVSAISWRSLEPLDLGQKVGGGMLPSESLQRIANESMRKGKTGGGTEGSGAGRTSNSIFHDIVREEKRKNSTKKTMPIYPDNYLKKSIVYARPIPLPVTKAKCCGLIKSKPKYDKQEEDIVDMQTFAHETVDDEISNINGSNRSSMNSYRRRSSPVGQPVSEKHKEINKYLNNV